VIRTILGIDNEGIFCLQQCILTTQFLPEDLFVSKPLSLLLLALHIIGLVVCAIAWVRSSKRLDNQALFIKDHHLSPHYIAYTLLASNFIGIAFARTLHYQFYSWYFHAVPYLLWTASTRQPGNTLLKLLVCLALLAAIEVAFLTFPATPQSSAILQICHLLVLATIRPPRIQAEELRTEAKAKLS
jgi:alpha-1,3-mannosyltransferase